MRFILLILICFINNKIFPQFLNQATGYGSNISGGFIGGSKANIDSFRERSYLSDSINLEYSFLESNFKPYIFSDSSLSDINEMLNIPKHYISAGNEGLPYLSYIFEPNYNIGWNSGYNIFDNFLINYKNMKIFKTNMPFARVGYLFGTNEMQGLSVLYTQNFSSRVNIGIDFKNFSSPGFFKNQNSYNYNFNSYLQYESLNKFYKLTIAFIDNTTQGSSNGGVLYPNQIRDGQNIAYDDRKIFPVYLGNQYQFSTNILNNVLNIGNKQTDRTTFISQQFNFGKVKKLTIIDLRDSATKIKPATYDTLIRYYRIPEYTLEYTFKNHLTSVSFKDMFFQNDSMYYKLFNPLFYKQTKNFNTSIIDMVEYWDNIHNKLRLVYYPNENDLNSYFSSSIELINTHKVESKYKSSINQNNLEFATEFQKNYYLNNVWKNSIYFKGVFYVFDLLGSDKSNNNINVSLNSKINFKLFNNISELSLFYSLNNPNYFANSNSLFYIDTLINTLTSVKTFSSFFNFRLKNFSFKIQNTIFKDYVYYKNHETPSIESELINVFQVIINKDFIFGKKKYWHLESEIAFQPNYSLTNNKPLTDYISLPDIWVYNRFYFMKQINKKSLYNVGLEIKYNTPYKAPNYSPLIAKFIVQKDFVVINYPTVNIFFTLKIRGCHLYWKIENLNTIVIKSNAIAYTMNNFVTPNIPGNELLYKFGIWWNLIN